MPTIFRHRDPCSTSSQVSAVELVRSCEPGRQPVQAASTAADPVTAAGDAEDEVP